MTQTIQTDVDFVHKLATALRAHERAKVERKPGDNPFDNHDLTSMAGAGLLKGAERYPAQSMAHKSALGNQMEEARTEQIKTTKADKSAKRMAVARARAARKAQFDKIVESPAQPDRERLAEAWLIVAHLAPIISQIADSKRRWAARYLGDVLDDVAQLTIENMALLLAKSDKDLEVLLVSARDLAEKRRKSGRVPHDQLTEAERKERRAVSKGRKWLMQVANNRVHSVLVDTYLRSHNLRWQNIDLIATVMANISGVGSDPMMANFKADRAPAFLGEKFQRPGGIDGSLLATAINAAITEHSLDAMTELLLNEENRRSNGSFKWSKLAEQVFLATPEDGDWLWQAVVAATTGYDRDGNQWTTDRARKARADAARTHVRQLFEWLPGLITSVIEAFDPQMIGWSAKGMAARNSEGEVVNLRNNRDTQVHAILASEFELHYLPERPERRMPLTPRLTFVTVEEAAQAIVEHMAGLVGGNEFVAQAVNA